MEPSAAATEGSGWIKWVGVALLLTFLGQVCGDADSEVSDFRPARSDSDTCVEQAIDATYQLWLEGLVDGPWDEAAARRGAEVGCAG